MPETSSPEQSQPTKNFFEKPSKQSVLNGVRNEIAGDIRTIDRVETDPDKREAQIFGSAFESIAREENRQNRSETIRQKNLRELIEGMYASAELILGTAHERPSKPDGVSVCFNDQGQLVINEILEFKSSENAIIQGIDKDQPSKTLDTIGSLVTILNRLIKGDRPSDIKPSDPDLNNGKRWNRITKLQEIQKQVQEMFGKEEKITYAEEIIYRIIVPSEVYIPKFDSHFLKRIGYSAKIKIQKSNFSKHDIHNIIQEIRSSSSSHTN